HLSCHAFDGRMELGIGQQLVANLQRFGVLAGELVSGRQTDGVGGLGISIDRRLELGNGGVVLFAIHGDQAQVVVSLGDDLLLGFLPLGVGDLRVGLGGGLEVFDRPIEILVGLGQLLFFVQVVFAGVGRENFSQHQGRLKILGIDLQHLLAEDLCFVGVSLLLIGLGFQHQGDFLKIGVGELGQEFVGCLDDAVRGVLAIGGLEQRLQRGCL